jgi:hypothetical protein
MARKESYFNYYNTIFQLDMFCKKEGKWIEVLCVQLFFFLRDHPEWLSKCRLDTQTMVTLAKSPQMPLRKQKEPQKPSDVQGPPTMSKRAVPVTEIKSAGEPQEICPSLRKLVNVPTAPSLPPYPATFLH